MTRAYQEHDTLFREGQWLWGDSAYPQRPWLIAPYKRPLSEIRANKQFNYYVSKVCSLTEFDLCNPMDAYNRFAFGLSMLLLTIRDASSLSMVSGRTSTQSVITLLLSHGCVFVS